MGICNIPADFCEKTCLPVFLHTQKRAKLATICTLSLSFFVTTCIFMVFKVEQNEIAFLRSLSSLRLYQTLLSLIEHLVISDRTIN
jgi:hypothetical protein